MSSSHPAATQATDLRGREPALGGRQAGQLDVLDAHPAQPAQHGQRVGVLGLVAVVERSPRPACPAGSGAPAVHEASTWSSVTAWKPAAASACI